MSAIFGIINKKSKFTDGESINRIKEAIAHRATNGSGLWQSDYAALGFCKLIVYPQQINEQLPVETADLVLTADARIDNRDELYSSLNLDKQQYAAEPDSYLILKAYQKWGEQCVDHLEGEYVFAIWNKTSQQLFMATDHIGFRPVFYYDSPDELIFCSEIKGVVAAKITPNYFNEAHLMHYHFRQSPPNQTYNKEIFALCGGSVLKLIDSKTSIEKYWTPKSLNKYHFLKDEDWINCFKDLLYQAVEKRLNPDVPVGITLSGGLDSTSIGCILSELLAKKNKPLYAFSSVLPLNHTGVEQDERQYIEIVNKHCPNIIQTYVEAPGKGPFYNVEDAFEKDECLPNGFFYIDHAILAAAQEKKIRNLFTGFGGDHWVSWKGNTVIYQLIQQKQLKLALNLLKQFSETEDKNLLQLIRTEYAVYTAFYKRLRKLIKPDEVNWQIQTVLKNDLTTKYSPFVDLSQKIDNKANMEKLIESGFIGRLTGLFANRNSYYNMNSSDPMFDKNIMAFLMEAPLHLFNKNGYKRGFIRHAMAGVIPAEIQWRKDKLPYTPDFVRRTLQSREILNDMMAHEDYAFVFDKYFSKEIIEKHFDQIEPFAGFSNSTSVMGIRMMQAGISCKVFSYLKKKNYLFT